MECVSFCECGEMLMDGLSLGTGNCFLHSFTISMFIIERQLISAGIYLFWESLKCCYIFMLNFWHFQYQTLEF